MQPPRKAPRQPSSRGSASLPGFCASVAGFSRKTRWNPEAKATRARSLPSSFPLSCELCLRDARRNATKSVTSTQDLVFKDTLLCVTGTPHIAARVCALVAHTRCAAVVVLTGPLAVHYCASCMQFCWLRIHHHQGTAILYCKLSALCKHPHNKRIGARTPPNPSGHIPTTYRACRDSAD